MKKHSKLRLMGAAAALVALTAVAAGGPASAGARGLGSSIKIKGNNDPHFVAPDTVSAGQDLQIVNKTDPQKIGPHTFSLVTKDQLPKTRKQIRRCEHFHLVCKDIGIAHDANDEGVGIPSVENGLEGWDTPFDGTNPGDSWFSGEEDETTSRQVTAEAGAKLFFLCAVHPFMQGHVKVVDDD